MKLYSIEHRAYRVTWFLTVQLIALIGWIIVQSFFSLSPLGQNLGFTPTIVVEAIWWIATLVIMFVLFKREYNKKSKPFTVRCSLVPTIGEIADGDLSFFYSCGQCALLRTMEFKATRSGR